MANRCSAWKKNKNVKTFIRSHSRCFPNSSIGPRSRDCIIWDSSVIRATLDVRSENEETETFETDDGTLDTPANIVSERPGFFDSMLDLDWSNLVDVYGKGSETFIQCEACPVALNIHIQQQLLNCYFHCTTESATASDFQWYDVSQSNEKESTTTTILRLPGLCLGQPGWASTRKNIHSLTPIVVINHPLSASSIFYDPWHPPCSIYMPDSLSPQSLSQFSSVYLLAWHPPLHTPYISSPSHCLFFSTCPPYHRNLFCCSTKIMSSNPSLSQQMKRNVHCKWKRKWIVKAIQFH